MQLFANKLKKNIMKTFSTILVCLIISLNSIYRVNAIELDSYTAKDGYPSALDFVRNNLGFNLPELLAIGTAKAEIDFGGTTNEIGMDMTNGESKGWSYAFIDRQNGDTAIVGVGKFLGFYQAQDISDQIPEFFPNSDSKKLVDNYINSNVLVDEISKNTNYQNYIIANPTATPNLVTLMNNYDNPSLKQDYPYWTTYFGDLNNFICYTDAITGETMCDVLSTVKTFKSVANSFAPNPANNSIKLNITDNPASIYLIDIFGNKVYETKSTNIVNIDLTNLASGNYTIVYEYKNRIETEKLIIKK